ncbi:hypothetical protein D9615_000284 [Tricholomella constricta]|uniref:CCHC-type domain-containing protein n=1 Tax=Tricholomella constricta TaxID=117010 RepID=A0A8H5MBE1_9AGAR|nr:hypothetical protein D9615_000284 [Tricholomella constricta]
MSSTIVEPNTTIRYQNFEGPSFTQRRPSPPPFETSPASTGPPMQGTFGSNRSRLEHQIFQPGQHEGDFSSVSQDPRRPLPRTPSNVFNPSYQLATPNYPPLPPSATTSGPPLSSNQTPGSYYERLRHPEMFQRRDRAREEGQGQFARQQNPFLHGSDHERILYELRMTREEFSRQAHELLVETMGMDHQPRTPEQWANLVLSTMQLHEAHRLPPQLTVLLQMGGNERRLRALAGEIQTSNEGRRFSDPQSAGRSFHMPIQEPVPSRIETRFEEPPRATSTVNTQTASALLRRMNQGNAPPSQEGFEPTVTPGADARRAPTFGFWGAHNLQRIPEENPPVEGPFSRPNSGFQGPQRTFANQEGVPPREPENIPLPPSERGIPTPLSYAHSYELREENSERREGAPPRAREDWRQTPPHLASQNRRSPQGPRPISPRERRGIGADPGPGQNVNILDGRQGTQQQFPQFEQYRTGYNPGPAPPIPGGRPNPQYNGPPPQPQPPPGSSGPPTPRGTQWGNGPGGPGGGGGGYWGNGPGGTGGPGGGGGHGGYGPPQGPGGPGGHGGPGGGGGGHGGGGGGGPPGNSGGGQFTNPQRPPPPPQQLLGPNQNLTPEQYRHLLNLESKIDIRKPDPFTGKEPRRWKTFVTECLVTFQAKAITYEQDHLKVSFASSYLKDGAMDYFRLQLTYNPQHPMFTNWEGFVHELGSRFGIPNSRVEAENNISRLKMKEWEKFTAFIIKFEQEAYETGWNWVALQFTLRKALPQRILNVLAIAPSPETYEGYRDLVTQIDRRYWEHRIENPESYKPLWANNANTSNTSARPPMGPSAGPASRTTPQTAQGNRNARLNAESHDQDPDSGKEGKAQDQEIAWDDEEALQANNFGFKKSTRPWVKIDEDVKQQRIRDKACILCGDLEHWMRDCPTANAMGRATYLIGDDIFEFHHKTEEGNAGAIQDLPGL